MKSFIKYIACLLMIALVAPMYGCGASTPTLRADYGRAWTACGQCDMQNESCMACIGHHMQ